MYEIYLSSGVTILLIGLLSTIYFSYVLKSYKAQNNLYALSEAFATITVGIFYIYSSIVLHQLSGVSGSFNFTLPEDSYIVNTSELQAILNQSALNTNVVSIIDKPIVEELTSVTEEIFYLVDDASTKSYVTTEENEKFTDIKPISMQKNSSKVDMFLKNYQNMFKNLLHKNKNKSNQSNSFQKETVLNVRHERQSTETSNMTECTENCKCPTTKEIILQHTMLVYAFVQGITSLINSVWSSKSINAAEKTETNDSNTETNNEIPQNKSKIQKLFVNVRDEAKKDDEITTQNTENKLQGDMISYKLRYLTSGFILFVTFILPLAATLPLNYIMEDANQNLPTTKEDKNFNLQLLIQHNRNSSFVNKPLHLVTNHTEVNKVIENVYDIVSRANNDKRTVSANTPTIFEIVNYFNSKIKPKNCFSFNDNVKIHTFILFLLGYFLVILYAKFEQTNLKNDEKLQNKVKTNLNYYILMHSAVWFPSIIEIFLRTYMNQENNPNVTSAILLTIGNLQKIFSNVFYVKNARLLMRKYKNIEPKL